MRSSKSQQRRRKNRRERNREAPGRVPRGQRGPPGPYSVVNPHNTARAASLPPACNPDLSGVELEDGESLPDRGRSATRLGDQW